MIIIIRFTFWFVALFLRSASHSHESIPFVLLRLGLYLVSRSQIELHIVSISTEYGDVHFTSVMQAARKVPCWPRCGLRAKFRANAKDILAPEIVRPLRLDQAIAQLTKTGLVGKDRKMEPQISWEEARNATQAMVEESLCKPNLWMLEYIQKIGPEPQTIKATRQYAE